MNFLDQLRGLDPRDVGRWPLAVRGFFIALGFAVVAAFGWYIFVWNDDRPLLQKAEADELVMRSTLLRGLEQWLKESGLTQIQAAKVLGITQARVSDIKRGKFKQFSLDMLVRLASRAGLKPRLKLAA